MSAVMASVRSWHRPMMLMVATMAAMVVVAGVGLLVDGRELVDGSVWAKPFKFGVSFVIYGTTLAWMLSKVRKAPRTMWTLGTAFAVTGFVDVGFIVLQAARGTYSHFSTAPDPINVIGQQIFQSGVIGLFGVSLVLAVMLLFQRVADAAMTWALRAGIGLAAAGMAVAFYIVGAATTDTHDVPDAYGNTVTLAGQHGVGVPEGHGMPITNWSVQGGDLRVPHFIGLHAVQLYIAAALVLAALATRVVWLRSARVRAQLTGVVILGYTGLFVITTWQAMRGQSLVHPDGATWTAVGVLALVTAAAAALTIGAARRTAARGAVEAPRELDTAGV